MKDAQGLRILVGVLALIVIAGGALWAVAIRDGRGGP